jgi:hypothetical protein
MSCTMPMRTPQHPGRSLREKLAALYWLKGVG